MSAAPPGRSSTGAVAISAAEEQLGELRVRARVAQAERLLAWAQAWPQRTWAVEGAGGTGHLLAHQLVSAGERVAMSSPSSARAGPAAGRRGREQERPGRCPLGGRGRAGGR
jgi:transposase